MHSSNSISVNTFTIAKNNEQICITIWSKLTFITKTRAKTFTAIKMSRLKCTNIDGPKVITITGFDSTSYNKEKLYWGCINYCNKFSDFLNCILNWKLETLKWKLDLRNKKVVAIWYQEIQCAWVTVHVFSWQLLRTKDLFTVTTCLKRMIVMDIKAGRHFWCVTTSFRGWM